jgi:UDPglucose 6-dehydrogenase
VETDKARELMLKIYVKFYDKILVTNIETAEIIKHASNSFLAMKISFINLISDLCEKTDADIEQVAKGMGHDPRIGSQFLRAGLGYGGSCFPKDVRALIKIGEDLGMDFNLLKQVDFINNRRTKIFIEKVRKALWILKEKKIAILGLSFKPQTDDIRNAPSIKIIKHLLGEGALLNLYDPQAMDNMKEVFPEDPPRINYMNSAYDSVEGVNATLIVTEWDEFKKLDLGRLKQIMANPIIVDGRNIFEPDIVREYGFEYYSIGRL